MSNFKNMVVFASINVSYNEDKAVFSMEDEDKVLLEDIVFLNPANNRCKIFASKEMAGTTISFITKEDKFVHRGRVNVDGKWEFKSYDRNGDLKIKELAFFDSNLWKLRDVREIAFSRIEE